MNSTLVTALLRQEPKCVLRYTWDGKYKRKSSIHIFQEKTMAYQGCNCLRGGLGTVLVQATAAVAKQ